MPEITPEQRAEAVAAVSAEVGCLLSTGRAIQALLNIGWTPPGPDLTDPNVVHANMLRGGIAKPTPAQIMHIYGAELTADAYRAGAEAGIEAARDREARYGAIAEMIHANGPGGVVDVDVATKASAYRTLNWLLRIKAEPPRIFSHGGNAVVFTWDRKGSSHLLTICDRVMVLSEMPRAVPQPGEGGADG